MRNLLSILFCLFAATALVFGQADAKPGPGKTEPTKTESTQKTAEEAFKNIQSLKGTPADQLLPAMQYFSASLGVQCNFCHVASPAWSPEKDDKEEKKTARAMITMTQSINQANFKGRTEVGCATCHGGRSTPVPVPPLGDDRPQSARQTQGNPAQRPQPPSPDQVLQSYFTAVGGKAALEKLTSKVMKGTMTLPQGKVSFEMDQKAPNMYLMSVKLPKGPSFSEGFDGKTAWRKGDRGPVGELTGPELVLASVSAHFFDPDLNPAPNSIGQRVGSETVNGHECYVVREGTLDSAIFERLYFDKQSGLLVRRTIIERTLFGPLPNIWDYSDYRDVNGVKVPFTIVRGRWDGGATLNADSLELNVPTEDAKFQKPAASAPVPPGDAR